MSKIRSMMVLLILFIFLPEASLAAKSDEQAIPFSAYSERQPLEQLDFQNVYSTQSKQELMELFIKLRDQRFLVDPDYPQKLRRNSWLYAGGGCEVRTALAVDLAEQINIPLSKLFIFGPLKAYSAIGDLNWVFHVAPIIKYNDAIYVLDPAVSPNAPMPLEGWYQAITHGGGYPKKFTASICDKNAYGPYETLCINGPSLDMNRVKKDEEFNLSFERQFIRDVLKRDPELEL